jgi:DNA polymerase-3 subunit alpha
VNARPVASLGVHFATPTAHPSYRLLSAIRQGKTLDALPARLGVSPAHHLARPDEVHERFRDLPEAVTNTRLLGELCRGDVLPRGRVPLPVKLPSGQDPNGYLKLLCERAIPTRAWQDESAVRRRLTQELAVIAQFNLSNYFVTVAEIAAESRRQGWPMSLRGSAGSSLVCYLLAITDVDPLRHGLRLERFLHAGRASVPDIDLDFASQYRSQLFTWVVRHFGQAHTARVGLWQKFGPRSAFAAAAAAHGVTPAQMRPLTEALGDDVERLADADDAREALAVPLPVFPLDPPVWPRLLASARLLLRRPHEFVTHPSGFLLTSGPTEDWAPLQRAGAVAVTQLDKVGVERIGLVKVDLLSNPSLSVLSETRQHLRAQSPAGGPALPDDDADPATLDLLAAADVLGVSQLETPNMRRLLRQIRPKGVADLVQALAVTRPGAAKRGGKETFLKRRCGAEPVTYAHPALEPVLKENRGVILFDDDVLGVIEALTGLPAAEADRLRKRLTDAGQAEEAGAAFLGMLEKKGIGRTAALVLDQLTKFKDYAFCKSHAVAYALVAWQECFARAHYPVPFWCAVLNHHHGNYPRRVYVEAAKRSGVGFHLPCVNRSQAEFTQEVGAVRTGLSAVRSLDSSAVGLLLEERRQAGPFRDMSDFRRRVTLTPQDLALLVRSGCFDFSGRSRESLLQETELTQLGKLPTWWEGRREYGPWPLDALPPSFALAFSWRQEWELLGFLAGPPLLSLARACVPAGLADSRSLDGLAGERVKLAGLLATPLEAGEEGESQLLTLEDEYGLVEVRTAAGVGDPPGQGPLVLVEGALEDNHGVPVVVDARVRRPLPGDGEHNGRVGGYRLRLVQ